MTQFISNQCDCSFDLEIKTTTNDAGQIFPINDYDLSDHMNLKCACGNTHNLHEFINGELQLLVE